MILSPETLPAIQGALRDAGLDGWLLYDFRGANPVAASRVPDDIVRQLHRF